MKKLLVVYNTCEIGGQSNTPWYIDCVRSILYQTLLEKFGDDFKVAISGCRMSDPSKSQLMGVFRDNLSYNWVEEILPLSVTFNDTVDKCVNHFGPFEGYLYIDSGVSFWDPSKAYDAMEKLFNVFKSEPYAICAAMPSNDDGSAWWGIHYEPNMDYVFPVGKATNMHCQIFSEDWRLAYHRVLPDIFASNCMESVFSNMAAAIHKRYVITQQVFVQHLHSLDGASIGSREASDDKMPMSKVFPTGGLLFKTKKDMDERYNEGHELGFGWEECSPYWLHDPTKFDENGALDDRLQPFLKREMYLKPEEFDYSTIKTEFHPGS